MTFGAVTSTVHGMMKFPMPAGIATLYADRKRTIECVQINRTTVTPIVHDDGSVSPNPVFPYQKIIIGNTLTKETKEKLYKILAANIDVFACQVSDMTEVPRHIAEHKLNVNPNIQPVCQKKIGMAPERIKFLRVEVKNLVDAGILWEVKYQTWVANSMMVNMKLNPKKCTFGVQEGKFLGYIVTERGIKANPKKIQAIEDMASPKMKKEVQSLNGRLAALTRFLSRVADRSLPFMKVLKSCLNKKDFAWTEEAETAF
ncbi:uncharacterized protein [Rutidosis leptorrhynchoides]|uniref:uncharacterized protein n=1 Tax=Rutidosis leptorrhynchoides TaxID=125765 RepID=UPI003A98F8F9